MSRPAWPLLAAAIVATAVVLPFGINEQLLTAAITALELIYLAQCWNIVAGYAGLFSLGHSLFFGIGAYASTVLLLTFGILRNHPDGRDAAAAAGRARVAGSPLQAA